MLKVKILAVLLMLVLGSGLIASDFVSFKEKVEYWTCPVCGDCYPMEATLEFWDVNIHNKFESPNVVDSLQLVWRKAYWCKDGRFLCVVLAGTKIVWGRKIEYSKAQGDSLRNLDSWLSVVKEKIRLIGVDEKKHKGFVK